MNWTPEEVALAETLFASGAADEEFRARLGRSRCAARTKICNIRWAARIAEKRASGVSLAKPILAAPEHVIADAIKRATAPRSITSVICGDPPVGFSALERRA